MIRSRTAIHTATALAAAGLVLTAGCAHPAAGPASPDPAGPGPSSSSTSSTPAPAAPGVTASPATTPAAAPAPAPITVVSTSPYPHGRAGVPAGGLPAVSTRTSPDPDVVAAAALRVLFTSDTALDTEPMDAEKRAMPWLGGGFAAAVRAAAIAAAPGAVWNGWAAHRAHLVVTVVRGWDDGAPVDTATVVHRQWLVTQTPVGIATGGARWVGSPVRTVVYTTTTRLGGRWAVTTLKEAP